MTYALCNASCFWTKTKIIALILSSTMVLNKCSKSKLPAMLMKNLWKLYSSFHQQNEISIFNPFFASDEFIFVMASVVYTKFRFFREILNPFAINGVNFGRRWLHEWFQFHAKSILWASKKSSKKYRKT